MDSQLIPQGLKRTSIINFALWQIPWLGLLGFGLLGAFFCLFYGLNQTGMNDYFAFGVWIVFDLVIIALGAGAFFTGFLTYVLGKEELKSIINLAVVIGFICYSSAMAMLAIDIGQPIKFWFILWHSNVHSMLTEVSFCITVYFMVLTIEYIPNILENRKLNKVPEFKFFAHNLHEIMFVFAATGTFLSFFHQGSLGGMFGVLEARPFAGRAMFGIWPTTFPLFIISAVAAGPCFTLLIASLMEKIGGKRLITNEARQLLAKVSGGVLAVYIVLKIIDTIAWIYGPARDAGFSLGDFYRAGPYGIWLLYVEIGLLGILPAVLLNIPSIRKNNTWLIVSALLTCAGVIVNRFVMVIETLAIPVLPFEKFVGYLPTWQEWAIIAGVIGYAGLILSLSYRYLPVFPNEKELNI
ncbi:MAG: polysulfide reductase NrfD [Deltaproteobacteria bacterium]|nr:polysulfide reductase NrfD [Deltaproteobacteria bacterium]